MSMRRVTRLSTSSATRHSPRHASSAQPRSPKPGPSWFYGGSASMPVQMSAPSGSTQKRAAETLIAEPESQLTKEANDMLAPTSTVLPAPKVVFGKKPQPEPTELEKFIEQVQLQEDKARLDENQRLNYPRHPDQMVPEFRRIKRHAKQIIVIPDPDYPTYPRKDTFVALPPAKNHPWVQDTPFGPHIVHGDGLLGVVGTGEVGFDNESVNAPNPLPKTWRGLQHRSIVGRSLPNHNGSVLEDTVVKHSFSLTGRGVFATADVKAGEIIMVVSATAQSLGLDGEQRRLVNMCSDILISARDGSDEEKQFLHDWILSGQMSSLMERWPERLTNEVIERIGGASTLETLELHRNHIARLAAVIDMNSFVVESSFDERKGCGYWPEAGFYNHSCDPNATYEIIPEHAFKDSEFYAAGQAPEPSAVGEDELADDATDNVSKVAAAGHSTSAATSNPAAPSAATAVVHNASNPDAPAVPSPSTSLLVEDLSRVNLTATGAPNHLFCMRSTKDIKAGEEILISYVPVEWGFNARQYVLHDRYRFRCKCPRCAPTIDSKYAIIPRSMLLVMAFLLSLQLWLMQLKYNSLDTDLDGTDPEGQTPMSGKRLRVADILRQARQNDFEAANYDMGNSRGLPREMYGSDPMLKDPR